MVALIVAWIISFAMVIKGIGVLQFNLRYLEEIFRLFYKKDFRQIGLFYSIISICYSFNFGNQVFRFKKKWDYIFILNLK